METGSADHALSSPSPITITPLLARAIPFAVFMAFIAVEEGARSMIAAGIFDFPRSALYFLYPLKATVVALLLYLYRNEYRELTMRELSLNRRWLVTVAAGVATFFLWIALDWRLPVTASPAGFDPMLLPAGPVRVMMTLSRVVGAVLVVPVMEELFWRSFLLRYLVDADFESVPIGRFTWSSFLCTALLFGLEHHFIIAGIAAGIIYSAILYKTRSLAHCILAHAVTNLALAGYILYSGKWYFW